MSCRSEVALRVRAVGESLRRSPESSRESRELSPESSPESSDVATRVESRVTSVEILNIVERFLTLLKRSDKC